MPTLNTSPKVTWWQATKVTWAFLWRQIVFAMVPAMLLSFVVSFIYFFMLKMLGFDLHNPLIRLIGALLGALCGAAAAINLYRIMLNKGEFKSFTFKVK